MRAIAKLASIALIAIVLLTLARYTLTWYVASSKPVVQNFQARTHAEFAQLVPDTDLPKSATGIRWMSSAVGLGGRAYVGRFTATKSDCETFARQHFANYSGMGRTLVEFLPVTNLPLSKPDLAQAYGIHDLAWFDIEKLQHGYSVLRPQDSGPFIWIDTDRDVLYCWWTD